MGTTSSIYEFADSSNVDMIFRRINAGGRKLSRQELRAAGATGHFAQVVRKLGAKTRGDDSLLDVLRLGDMKKISITNRDLDYGIPADQVFWVKEGILTKEQIRESGDEQIIADIVAYMVSDDIPSSRAEYLDDFFSPGAEEASIQRYNEIEASVQKRSTELVIADFSRVLDEIRLTLSDSGKNFGELLFGRSAPARAPRYFQAVFLAFYELLVKESMAVANRRDLVQRMEGCGPSIPMGEGGGRWGAEQRERAVQAVKGMYRPAFKVAATTDPAQIHWITQLENLLAQSFTEQSAYDFKQGFLRLDGSHGFDESSFDKILETCVGIANLRKGAKGYVLIGVADKLTTAQRVEALYKATARPYEGFYITGVDHEAVATGKNLDQLFNFIIDKVKNSKVSPPLRDFIARHLKPVRYYDKTVYVFEVEAQEDPSSFDGKYFERHGANVNEIKSENLPTFIRRYILGS